MFYITKFNTVRAYYDGIENDNDIVGNIDDDTWVVYSSMPDSYKIENGKFIALKTLEEVKNIVLNEQYIPKPEKYVSLFMRSYLKTNPLQDTEEKLMLSGLYDTFDSKNPQKREVGDLVNYAGQTYECIQAHDEAVYPDINPNNTQTWHTFYKPLHGKSKETARPWEKPQYGTTDMYLKDEYMVYTDGKTYKCLSDTVYSPEEYSKAWKAQE